MKLDIDSFCFKSIGVGFGFLNVGKAKEYYYKDEDLAKLNDNDFVHFGEINYYNEIIIKLLNDKKIKFNIVTVEDFSYYIISSEEASKYILSTLNSL